MLFLIGEKDYGRLFNIGRIDFKMIWRCGRIYNSEGNCLCMNLGKVVFVSLFGEGLLEEVKVIDKSFLFFFLKRVE